jgi:hypothetical protein
MCAAPLPDTPRQVEAYRNRCIMRDFAVADALLRREYGMPIDLGEDA